MNSDANVVAHLSKNQWTTNPNWFR